MVRGAGEGERRGAALDDIQAGRQAQVDHGAAGQAC
jgi:hypothetical protein